MMKKKIKVLQVIPRLGYGGAETGCYDLAHFLPENDCKSFIVTSGGELLKFINKKKVKVLKLPVQSKNPILILLNAIIISFIILVYNINIVHARSRAPAWSCFLATRFTFRNFVTTYHGTYNFNNKIKKLNDVYTVDENLVCFSDNFNDVIEEIRSFLRINMYNNTNVLKKNENGKKIIKKLFNKIAKNPRKFLNKEQLKFDKHRAIADFISGMTDRYAINLYKKI